MPASSQPPLTNQQVQEAAGKALAFLTSTFKIQPPLAQQIVQNAIHQGAHQLIHDATKHMDAHHAPGGASDSQARTSAGGARKDAVDKVVGSGKWREEDRQFLMDLPDDHFERVQKNVLAGATNLIQPYTYEGIGDRSNAHTANAANAANQTMTEDQYIANAPPGVREVLINALATARAEKERLAALISNQGAGFNKDWLMVQDVQLLRGMARLLPNGQSAQQPTANYSGQAALPMFVIPQAPTVNADDQANVLPLPNYSWSDQQTA